MGKTLYARLQETDEKTLERYQRFMEYKAETNPGTMTAFRCMQRFYLVTGVAIERALRYQRSSTEYTIPFETRGNIISSPIFPREVHEVPIYRP
jgi:hypothetical protein